jgi:uncharacterized protein YkwD
VGTSILSCKPRHGATLKIAGLFIAALVVAVVLLGIVFTPQAQAAVGYSAEEMAFVNLINDYRASKGLGTLLVSDRISEACDRHNSDMGKYKFFSHYSLHSDWFPYNALPWDRMAMSGYDFYTEKGENIAAGQVTAEQVFNAWKASSGHNANMLGSGYKVIGVSLVVVPGSPYTYYWTTDFGGYVDSSAHTLDGQPPEPPAPSATRYQQSSSLLAYTGTWSNSSTSYASGGSFRYINQSGASVTISFKGTSLAWIAKKSSVYGKAKVTVDGGTPVTVDLYSSTTKWQQKVWSTGTLADCEHTVKIEWTGTKNSAATNTNINADAFDIVGTLTQAPVVKDATAATRVQQGDSRLAYTATWDVLSTSSASGGSYRRVNTAGASVTITFDGTYLAWIAKTCSAYGKAKVTVDGGTPVTVDLYTSTTKWQQKVWSATLPAGVHTVKIEWTGTKNSASTGTYINTDAFDVIGTLK